MVGYAPNPSPAPAMTKAALFDIDDTLYALSATHAAALRATEAYAAETLGVPLETLRAAYRRAFDWQIGNHSDNAGFHSRAVRFQRALEELRLPLRFAAPLADRYWAELLDRIGAAGPADGAAELLRGLKERGVRVGVASDMTADWQLRKLDRLGLLDDLDFVVTSEEAGAEKPAAAFFALCLEKAGCLPEECVFVGDNLRKDALGALHAGMRAFWVEPDAAKRAERPEVPSVASLRELLPILLG